MQESKKLQLGRLAGERFVATLSKREWYRLFMMVFTQDGYRPWGGETLRDYVAERSRWTPGLFAHIYHCVTGLSYEEYDVTYWVGIIEDDWFPMLDDRRFAEGFLSEVLSIEPDEVLRAEVAQ